MPERRVPLRHTMTMAAVALIAGACPPIVSGQAVGYTGSFYGVHGSDPTGRVDSVYVFNGVDVTSGPVRVSVALPWVRVETTLPERVGLDTTAALSSTSTGWGDPLARLDVRVLDDQRHGVQLGVAAAIKMSLVDASTGRGTGETDYALGATAFKSVRRTALMADVLFWKYGDPDGVDLTDTWSYSLGVAQAFGSGRWSTVGSVSGFSSGLGEGPPPVALNLGVLMLMGRRQSLALTTSIGLTGSSSDVSIGTSWRITR